MPTKEDYFVEEHQRITGYFIVVDKSKHSREQTMNQIIGYLRQWGSAEIDINQEGLVTNSNKRYLFHSYLLTQKPEMIDWGRIKLPNFKDENLLRRPETNRKGTLTLTEKVNRFFTV